MVTGAAAEVPVESSLDLYWIPLGAGARIVRTSGRIYESLTARYQRREPCDLYHSALVAQLPEGRYFVEMTPVPVGDGDRGVVARGAVGSLLLGRFRIFQYEVRLWRDGSIPDLGYAVGGAVRITSDERLVRRAMASVSEVPNPVWGRDELDTGEMWNSNSVVSWVLARVGLLDPAGRPPGRGRAPGWNAGVLVAERPGTVVRRGSCGLRP